MEQVSRDYFITKKNVIGILQGEDTNQECIRLGDWVIEDSKEEIHFCKVEPRYQGIYGMVQIPVHKEVKTKEMTQIPLLGQGKTFARFSFFGKKGKLLFLDYDGIVERILQKWEHKEQNITIEEVLYRVMISLIENDRKILDVIYKQLASLEEEIPKDNSRFFLQRMYGMKQTIYQMFRYYHQLTEFSSELMDCGKVCFTAEELQRFEDFGNRTSRLGEEIEIMREYAMEIWEIYQSQINIRQNDIMKILTIVTTVFLPLSLLAAWYGMNFEFMPEISWKYGYPLTICVAIVIVVFCLIIFKRKKYW